MGLLPRVSKLAIGTAVALALLSLPTLRTTRNLGSALAPSIAWAGGSPDETLKPNDTPTTTTTPKAAVFSRLDTRTSGPVIGTERAGTRLTALQRWEIFFSVFRTFAIRF
ncbi:MAG: hypothetical protein ACM3PF_05100 [Bacteroidota bacterium]